MFCSFTNFSPLLSHKKYLNRHNREVHDGIVIHNCDLCNLQFDKKSKFKKHMFEVHNIVETHVCGLCQRSFSTKQKLARHEKIHTGIKGHIL